ncbi:uncharacterized protein METZ01_LOCUS308111, partial [marine metagenome]
VAEWLRSGLQSRVHRFDSDPRLQPFYSSKLMIFVPSAPDSGGLNSANVTYFCQNVCIFCSLAV